MNGRTLLLIKLSTHSLGEYCTVYQTHARKHTHKHPVEIRISISIFNRNNGMVLQMLIVISINPICSHCDTRDMTKVYCGVSPILLSNYIYIYIAWARKHTDKKEIAWNERTCDCSTTNCPARCTYIIPCSEHYHRINIMHRIWSPNAICKRICAVHVWILWITFAALDTKVRDDKCALLCLNRCIRCVYLLHYR